MPLALWHPATPVHANDDFERKSRASSTGRNGVPNADDSLPPSGPTLLRAFESLVSILNERKIHYAIIGGLAVIQHTRVRTTDDIDALLSLPQIAMAGFFETLAASGFEVDVEKSIREFRDNGLTTVQFDDVIVDLMRPVLPAYAHVLDRALETQILGHAVRISSAEGLIVMKLIASRPQDETDIQDLLASYGDTLDMDYVRTELDTVMDNDDPRREKLELWASRATRK
jgi:predicted nucleotidyltransferase